MHLLKRETHISESKLILKESDFGTQGAYDVFEG